MCRPEANDVNEVTKNLSHHFNAPNHFSIFVGQQNTGRRTVRFCNHPYLVTRAGAICAQEPKTVLQAELVFLYVSGGNFSPVAVRMASKKIPRLLARFSSAAGAPGVATT